MSSHSREREEAFRDCVSSCFAERELVAQFDRLTGSNLSLRGTELELAIDRASGRNEADAELFVGFVRDAIWERMP